MIQSSKNHPPSISSSSFALKLRTLAIASSIMLATPNTTSAGEKNDGLTSDEEALIDSVQKQAKDGLAQSAQLKTEADETMDKNSAAASQRLLLEAKSSRNEVTKAIRDGCNYAAALLGTESRIKFDHYQSFELAPGEATTRVLIQGCVNASQDLNESIDPFLVSVSTHLTAAGGDGDTFLKQSRAVSNVKSGEIALDFWNLAKNIAQQDLQQIVFSEVSGFANRFFCSKSAVIWFELKKFAIAKVMDNSMKGAAFGNTHQTGAQILAQYKKDNDDNLLEFNTELKKCWDKTAPESPLASDVQLVEKLIDDLMAKAGKAPQQESQSGGSLRPTDPVSSPPSGQPPHGDVFPGIGH